MNAELIDWAEDQIYGPGIDSTSRPYALADAMENAETAEQVWVLFNRGWPSCDAMRPDVLANIMKVLVAQQRLGTDYLDAENQAFFDGLPEVVTIYRGAVPARRLGIAWTTDIEVAREFALGHRGIRPFGSMIYRTEIAKTDIFTVSVEREESEVIIDPRIIKNMMQQQP